MAAVSDRDRYFRGGTLPEIPRRRAARLVVLDALAGSFEPGVRYEEKTVNARLSAFHADYCALRRYLVEEGFLERADGLYWRAGGSFEV